MRAILAFACAAPLLSIACGRGGSHSNAAKPTESAATAVTAPPATAKPSAASERLARALLSIEDLPGGWSRSMDARGTPADTEICAASLARLEESASALATAEESFQRGGSGPYLVQSVTAYPPGGAERVMANLGAATHGCESVTVKDEEGQATNWQLSVLNFPHLADETLALREYQTVNNVEAVVVYIRKDDLVTVLLSIAVFNRVDFGQTEAVARAAAARLSQYVASR